MKLFVIVCVAFIAIAMVECISHCNVPADCPCRHDQVSYCSNHNCICVHSGDRKRQHQHICKDDTTCADYDCTKHTGDTPFCDHHGPNEHGHSLCACQ